ncbi:MAG TPA: type II toxin-antitoxin system prevent-host-death family antitoxin [Pelobium sp.]|nr:type II toxin-antitoxin system prevent-host-death family antitoxin [Pelobium sp.]
MKTMTVSEFKTRFSDVIKEVKAGKKIVVTSGKKKEVVGYFVSEIPEKQEKRKLGILEGKATATFSDDFKMTEEELLGL